MAPPRSLRLRTLERALAITGSETRLARLLRAPAEDLRAWLAGKDIPPTGIFLAAVDVIESGYGFVERRRFCRQAGLATAVQAGLATINQNTTSRDTNAGTPSATQIRNSFQ